MIYLVLLDLFFISCFNCPSYFLVLSVPYIKKDNLLFLVLIALFFDIYLLKMPLLNTLFLIFLIFINKIFLKKINIKKFPVFYILINYFIFFALFNFFLHSLAWNEVFKLSLIWSFIGIIMYLFFPKSIKFFR